MGDQVRTLAAGGALVLVLAALVAATSDGIGPFGAGPVQVQQDEPEQQSGSGGERGSDPTPGETGTDRSRPDLPSADSASWTRWLAIAVLTLVAGAFLLAVAASFRVVLRRRRLRGDQSVRAGPGRYAEAAEEPEDETLATLLDERLELLDEGAPRNAIVAAWVRLEEFAVAQGLPRHDSDTPAEFVSRALAAYSLDATALERLAELYREARFSRHPLTEEHRVEARGCLRLLLSGVAAGTGQA